MIPLTTEEKIYYNKQKNMLYMQKKNLILVIKSTIK